MSEIPYKKYSSEEWDHLRQRFSNSCLNDTEIAKLGQNTGISWPFKGKGETASKYIEFDLEELRSVPGLIGKQSRIRALMDIFRETLAFDDPFSDMVDAVEAEFEADHALEDILIKLKIPPSYPREFVHLKEDTQEMLKNEDITTLIEIVNFGQKVALDLAASVALKAFLNSLAQRHEVGIAKYLPYRRGVGGLHFAEAIGLIANDLPQAAQLQLLTQAGGELKEDEQALLSESSRSDVEASIKSALAQMDKVSEWFRAEADELAQTFSVETSPERFFIVIDDPSRERLALELAKLHMGIKEGEKSGFFGKLFGR